MTLTTFNKLYGHYKSTWDFEMMLFKSGTTHEQAFIDAQKAEEWF